jgi:flagellin-like hook-associated protein FlgL
MSTNGMALLNIGALGTRSALGVQTLVEMRRQLDELQRQLGSGLKSETYAGLGIDRGLLVGLKNRFTTLEAFGSSIDNVGVRLDIGQTALGRLVDLRSTVKSAAFQASIQGDGLTVAQNTASSSLNEMLGLLNTQVGDRYLFSGLAADQPSVASYDLIMDGDATRAGFKQIVAERKQADLGTLGLGRLAITPPTPTLVQVAEEAPATVFGLKLASMTSGLSNATATGPIGAPPAVSVDFTGLPNAGESIELRFNLPDGSSEIIKLTATTSATPGPNEFTIGATPTLTAGNLQTALTASVTTLASTSLVAASAVVAADNFFNGTPQRVSGPPATAMALVAGTPANTVSWYIGEDGPVPPRSTATARVDTSIAVSYGMRASEDAFRWVVQNVAALAAVSFAPGDPDATARSAALSSRVGANLAIPLGTQKIEDVQSDLAGAQVTLAGAADRHRQTKNTLAGMMQKIEGVSTEEVAAQILALQTRLQASLQTTSLLYQTSLVNYL